MGARTASTRVNRKEAVRRGIKKGVFLIPARVLPQKKLFVPDVLWYSRSLQSGEKPPEKCLRQFCLGLSCSSPRNKDTYVLYIQQQAVFTAVGNNLRELRSQPIDFRSLRLTPLIVLLQCLFKNVGSSRRKYHTRSTM